MTELSNQKQVARPYHDLNTPFTVDEKGAFAEYIVQDPDSMPEIALGATIVISDSRLSSNFWIAGRIVGLRAISPFNPDRENLLYLNDEVNDPTSVLDKITGPHTHQPMVIRVQLDREIDMIDANSRKYSSYPIQRPPSSVSRLFFPNIVPQTNDPSPSMREILDIKEHGISLGNVGFGNSPYQNQNEFLTYKWDIENLDNKHVFIVGESGSGKTVFLKNLAYELRKKSKDHRVILTDVQGDIIQLLLPDIAEILKPSGWQCQVETETPDQATNHLKNYQLIIPATKSGSSTNTIALKKLAKNRGIQVREIGLRLQDLSLPSDVEYLFRSSSNQVGMLLDEEADYLKSSNVNQPVTIANLRGALRSMLQRAGKNNQVTSNGGTNYLQSTFFAGLRALRSLEDYFDFHQLSLSLASNPLDYFDFDGTSILYLDELDQDERIMWEMQLVKWLYNNKKANWNAYVFFDEAHQIIPAKPVGIGALGTFERLRVNFEKLAREGRKFGINLILSTQNPKDLHPIVPEQCPTRIIMKINPRNASYAFLEPELAMVANRFSAGQFWIQSPFNGTPDWVRVHSWAPPLAHEPMTNFWDKVIQKAREEL